MTLIDKNPPSSPVDHIVFNTTNAYSQAVFDIAPLDQQTNSQNLDSPLQAFGDLLTEIHQAVDANSLSQYKQQTIVKDDGDRETSKDDFIRSTLQPLKDLLDQLDDSWAARASTKLTQEVKAIPNKAKDASQALARVLAA